MITPKRQTVAAQGMKAVNPAQMSESLLISHRDLPGLTITVEKIDRVLAEIQAEIECLRRERTNLRLLRGELARMETPSTGG